MKPIPSLAVVTLASIMAAIGFTAHASEVPLGSHSMEGHIVTRVLAVDPANHQVTIEDANKSPVSIQLTEKAKTLNNLKVGDKVDFHVIRSVAYVLDTNVDAAPGGSNESVRTTQHNPDPGGEAVRKVKVTSKITRIDLKKHEVTLLPPEGELTVLKVEDPQLQAKMKKLQVGQTINAIYTEVMKIKTSR